MNQDMIIGLSVVISLVLIVGVKIWLQGVITFKMDESTILKYIEQQPNTGGVFTFTELSNAVDIKSQRVLEVCNKSKAISRAMNSDKT